MEQMELSTAGVISANQLRAGTPTVTTRGEFRFEFFVEVGLVLGVYNNVKRQHSYPQEKNPFA
jgi:hypothetical protein